MNARAELSYWLGAAGWLLLGLMGGLADSIMVWRSNGGQGCYQFPYLSRIGCQEYWHSWEICFVLTGVAVVLIVIGLRIK